MIATHIIVVPLMLVGVGIGVWVNIIIWREASRQLKPGSELRSQYRRNWSVGARSGRRWLTIAAVTWVLVAGCLLLDLAARPVWFIAVWIGLVAMLWSAIGVVCTVQGLRSNRDARSNAG